MAQTKQPSRRNKRKKNQPKFRDWFWLDFAKALSRRKLNPDSEIAFGTPFADD
jgi:hypothetical protein